jgi:sodium transport system permease protein
MSLRCTLTIFRKEIRDVLRDRRTLMVMLVLPILLYPIMIIVLSQVMLVQVKKLEEKTARVVVQGLTYSPILAVELHTIPVLDVVQDSNPPAALARGDIQMIISIPPGFDDSLQAGTTVGLKLYYDNADDHSNTIHRRIVGLIDSLGSRLAQERLRNRGMDPAIIHPIDMENINVATPSKMGAYAFGGMLALMLTMIALMGAFYPAIDLTAGEKERGTLETLLVSPASRMDIVMGKFFTVITISILTAFTNLLAMGVSIGYLAHTMMQGVNLQFSVSPGTLVLIFLLLLPVAILYSSVSMAIASFTRSFKESQNLLTPLQMIAVMMSLVAIIPGIEMTPAIAVIPIANVVLLIKEILLGEARLPMILLVFASIGVAAVIGVRWAVSRFQREDILFSQGENIRWGSLLRRPHVSTGGDVPGMGMAWLAYIIGLLLLFFVGQSLQGKDLSRGLLITEIALVAAPPLFIARRLGYNLGKTFRLKPPAAVNIIWTIVAAAAAWVIVVEISALQNEVFPYPQSFLDAFKKVFEIFHQRGIIYMAAMVALLPALCEETLFRGFILTGFRKRWGPTTAVILTGVLFGLFHLDPYRYLPTALLGVLIGAIVVWTGSLWAGMTAHFIANLTSTLVFQFTYSSENQALSTFNENEYLPIWLVIIAVVVLMLCVRFLYHYYRKSLPVVEQQAPAAAATDTMQ